MAIIWVTSVQNWATFFPKSGHTALMQTALAHQVESVPHLLARQNEACHQIAKDPQDGDDRLADALNPEKVQSLGTGSNGSP